MKRLPPGLLLSAYHLAEWLAWNWWRLRWEPVSITADWVFAHRLATVGGGYVWPNVRIFSDGERTALIAKPTPQRANTPFRYISDARYARSLRNPASMLLLPVQNLNVLAVEFQLLVNELRDRDHQPGL